MIALRLTIDSFAWIELIRGTPLGIEAKRLVEGAESCFTPAIVLAEVAHRCLWDGFEKPLMQLELRAILESSRVVPIDPDLAMDASAATTELRKRAEELRLRPPGLADGLILATARRMASRLLTSDPHFRGLGVTLWLG